MNNKISLSLVYFLTRSLFLGLIYSKLFNLVGQDIIISCLLGIIIGSIILYYLYKIDYENKSNKIFLLLLNVFFIYLGLMNIEYFINAYYLTNTPNIIIAIPIILLSIYASLKKDNVINNSSKILFIISIFTLSISFFLLANDFNLCNLLPILNTKFINIIKAALIFALASTLPNILIIDNNSKIFKVHLKYYILASLINTLVCLAILLTLSSPVAQMYSFPEYMVLKKIKFLNFIENIENILSIVYYFDVFILFTLSLKKIYQLIKNKYIFYLLIAFIVLFSTFKIINYYYLLLFIYNYAYLFFIIILFLLHKKKN